MTMRRRSVSGKVMTMTMETLQVCLDLKLHMQQSYKLRMQQSYKFRMQQTYKLRMQRSSLDVRDRLLGYHPSSFGLLDYGWQTVELEADERVDIGFGRGQAADP